jgi:hypothetical protein
VSGGVRNGEWDSTGHENSLGRDTARMENWNFIRLDRNGVTPVGRIQRSNANGSGATHTHGAAVRVLVFARNFHFLGDHCAVNRLHAYDKVAMEAARGLAGNVGFVHGNIQASFRGSQANASSQQGPVIGKGTSN